MAQAQASTRQSLQRTDSDWERDMAALKDGSDAKVREALDGARKAWEAQFAKLRADSDGKLRQLLVSTTHNCSFFGIRRSLVPASLSHRMDVLNIRPAFQTEVQRERAAREQAEARATAAESNHADGTDTSAIFVSGKFEAET